MEEVRRVADTKGVFDSPNFARHVVALDGNGMRIRGERAGREIKVNDAGFEAAGELAMRLLVEE